MSRPNQPAEPDNHQHSVNISQPPIPAVLRRLIALSCTKVAGRFMLCSFTLCQLPASQLLYVPVSLCPSFSVSQLLCALYAGRYRALLFSRILCFGSLWFFSINVNIVPPRDGEKYQEVARRNFASPMHARRKSRQTRTTA